MYSLIDEIASGYLPKTRELSSLIEKAPEYMFEKANEIKRRSFGDKVYIRGIIEFSSYCRCKCVYCGMSADCKALERYRMDADSITRCAIDASKYYKTIILQSGEDLHYTKEMLGEIVKEIKAQTKAVLTLSIGERSKEDYKYLKNCGADRFLLKHETSDEVLYNKLHPHSTFQNRLACLRALRDLGYEVGSGFMIGLPGQTYDTLANDILLLHELGVEMAGIGPFIAHPDTPLGKYPDGSDTLTLAVLAATRLVMHKTHLPSTTALNVKGGMQNALQCGANVIMQKATPYELRDMYDIYPGRETADISLAKQRQNLDEYLSSLGLISE